MRLALVVMTCVLVGHAEAAKPAKQKTSAGAAHFAGDLDFAIVGTAVQLTARGEGKSGPWGDVVAEAIWSPPLANVLALLAGEIDELTINTGTFRAAFSNGDTLAGTL